ncbi:MAG TPA: HAD family phosphatase [Ktedonosporobacter sp.]|nr:HAD family phosphatase [Ktedonosporobacter sp.]
MKYDAVIFDFYGTLVDNMDAEVFNSILGKMAAVLEISLQEIRDFWRESWPQRATGLFSTVEEALAHLCERLKVQASAEQLEEAARLRYGYARQVMMPRPDTVETLARLKEAGYKLGLISDCTLEVPRFWSETPMASLIDVAIFSCSVGLKKPDPRIYLLACDKLDVLPERCLYMGDGGSHELTGARSVGMTPVLIRVPYENASNTQRHGEEEWDGARITSVREILAHVDEAFAR